jgi:uncharacterized protein (TIGR00255 family)
MLLSMTGYGEGHRSRAGLSVSVEVRAINNRYFKLNVRAPEGYASLEGPLEAIVREAVHRGTVQLNLRIDRQPSADDFRINEVVLKSYREQLEKLAEGTSLAGETLLASVLSLPGVVNEDAQQHADAEGHWPLVREALGDALKQLDQMRQREGEAMAADMQANCQAIAKDLEAVAQRAPQVAQSYAGRLRERLSALLAAHDVQVQPADVIREVGLFAERCDISEEIVRLRSHLTQFDQIMRSGDSVGRKLDFVTQEMFRETNTIGSKANDSEIAKHVVEIKAVIERLKEMIQNVE